LDLQIYWWTPHYTFFTQIVAKTSHVFPLKPPYLITWIQYWNPIFNPFQANSPNISPRFSIFLAKLTILRIHFPRWSASMRSSRRDVYFVKIDVEGFECKAPEPGPCRWVRFEVWLMI
jgi:hypothetical protein